MTEPLTLDRVRAIFNRLDRDSLHLVDELYAPDVEFSDPFHRIAGRDRLRDYYRRMYENVQTIRFDFSGETDAGCDVVLYWTMTWRHPRVGGGEPVSLDGCTRLVFREGDSNDGGRGQVILHRDFFDAGAMLYEHLPLLGRGIRFIKARV